MQTDLARVTSSVEYLDCGATKRDLLAMGTEKPFWIVIALGALLLAPLVFIVGLILGTNIAGATSLTADSLSSWVGALATLAIAVLTFVLAKETWSLRIAQMKQVEEIRKEAVRPGVDLYLLSSPVSFQFMNVHVENNGRGVARNISFQFEPEGKPEFTEHERFVVDKFLKLNMLSNGISSLGVDKQRKSFAFSFLDVGRKAGDGMFDIRFKVKVSCSDVDGRLYSVDSIIDFSEYKGVSERGGGDPAYQLYKETEKIRMVLEGAQRGVSSGRFNVNTFSSEDRENEERAMDEWLEAQQNKKP